MKDALDRLYEKRKKRAKVNAFIRKLERLCDSNKDIVHVIKTGTYEYVTFAIRIDKES